MIYDLGSWLLVLESYVLNINHKNHVLESQNRFCQSCGIPMKKAPKNVGTNVDGTQSELYCIYCYQNGTFTFKGTVEEIQEYY